MVAVINSFLNQYCCSFSFPHFVFTITKGYQLPKKPTPPTKIIPHRPRKMSSQRNQTDSHQGGSLSDMAPTGTTIPNDAGIQNKIPSVPRPDQRAENPQFTNEGLGEPSGAFAADNAASMPRSPGDVAGPTGEVITGQGNTLPAGAETKRNVGNFGGDVREFKNATSS